MAAAIVGRLRAGRPAVAALAALLALAIQAAPPATADEMPVFRIELKDGVVTPSRLEVPANAPFKIELRNAGTTPAEFESLPLRKEKVVAAGTTTSLVIRRLDPGSYEFFDDFHPGRPAAVMVAR